MNALLRRMAAKAQHRDYAHVAIITRGGAVVAMGYNHGTVHAEDMALGKLWPSERQGTRLHSFRLRKNGSLGMAKPCEKCQALIEISRVKQVIYSNSNGCMVRVKVAR